MSDLEQDTKPIVVSLLDGADCLLDLPAQATLARWTVKTAMVFEAFNRDRPFLYEARERESLRTMDVLPSRTSVWIARCVDQPSLVASTNILATAPGPDQARAISTNIAFGALAIHAVTVRAPEHVRSLVKITMDVTGNWDDTTLQIWPASPVARRWPPSTALTGRDGLTAFIERLRATAA